MCNQQVARLKYKKLRCRFNFSTKAVYYNIKNLKNILLYNVPN